MLKNCLTCELFYAYVYTEMATIQKKPSRGRDYWAIVESRRINGKPLSWSILALPKTCSGGLKKEQRRTSLKAVRVDS